MRTFNGKPASRWRSDAHLMTEIVLLAGLAVLAGCVMWFAWSYPSGSVIYPFGVGGLLMLLVLARLGLLLVHGDRTQAVAEEDDESPREQLPWKSTAIYAFCVVALVASLNFVWFPVSAFVGGVAILRFVFRQSWLSAIVSSLLVSGISSAVFWALNAPLPGPGV